MFYYGNQKLQKIMNTASLSQGLLSRIEVSSEKVSIKIAKIRFGTQGAHFPVNWMELS